MADVNASTIVPVIGGVTGFIAFLWNLAGFVWNYFLSHLQIEVTCEKVKLENKEKIKITTIVENKNPIAKKIDLAFILISPQNQNFKISLSQIIVQSGLQVNSDELLKLLHQLVESNKQINEKILNNNIAIYSLPFLYDEQVHISNEKVKYSHIIDLTGFQKDMAFSIRFVTISKHLFGSYLRYRITSDAFIY